MTITSGLGGFGERTRDYYVDDDFGDGGLTSRFGASEGVYLPSRGDSNVYISRYRPAWTVDRGNVSPSPADGRIICPGSTGSDPIDNYRIRCISDIVYGTWSATFRNIQNPSSGYLDLSLKRPRPDHNDQIAWRNHVGSNASYLMKAIDGSTTTMVTTGGDYTDQTVHSVTVDRDVDSNWEVSIDGVVEGTTQDYYPKYGAGYTGVVGGGSSGYDADHEWHEVRFE